MLLVRAEQFVSQCLFLPGVRLGECKLGLRAGKRGHCLSLLKCNGGVAGCAGV
jgi:hypothetical protein